MKFNSKKVWRKIFTPRCFGDEKGKLQECVKAYLLENKITCKYYYECLQEGIRRQKLRLVGKVERLSSEKE